MSVKSQITYVHDTVSSSEGVVTFNLTATFVPATGDLPEGITGVFVRRAVSTTDPKRDEFVRVAQLGDLGTAATSREIALNPVAYKPAAATYIRSVDSRSYGLYLSSTVTMAFDRLDVAIQAKRVLEQRIDTLIADWKSYKGEFHNKVTTTFPLPDSAIVAKAKADYYAAASALTAAESALDDVQSDLVARQDVLDSRIAELQRIQLIRPNVCGCKTQLELYSPEYAQYFTTADAAAGRKALLDAAVRTSNDLSDVSELLDAASTATDAAADETTLDGAKTRAATAYDKIQAAVGKVSALSSFVEGQRTLELLSYTLLAAAHSYNYTAAMAKATAACGAVDSQELAATADKTSAQNLKDAADNQVAAAITKKNEAAAAKDAALEAVLAVCPSFTP